MTDAGAPLRVLHVDTERGWRGGQRQVLWLHEALARAGHRSLLAARPGEPLATRAAACGLPVVHSSPLMELDPAAAWGLRRVIRRQDIDIVHAHTAHAVALAALATLATSARVVITRRVIFPLRRNPGTRWKYARAAAVIAVSRAAGDALVAGGIPRSRITVVPSGIDLDRAMTPMGRTELRALGVHDGAPLVVQVAQLGEDKDPLTFVRAVAVARRSVPALQALMVGEGPLRSTVQAEIARLGLDGAIRLTGYRADADALIAAADVVALSSRQEGMPGVLLDALSLGKLVATTAAGGAAEAVEHERSGLVVPVADAPALGAAIARLITDRSAADRFRAAARTRAAAFSIARTTERTIEVYRSVLGRG
jgi:glycosyltransferase involved in cell wall biosynthesis